MKTIFLALICAFLKIASASIGRYSLQFGKPAMRVDSPVITTWTSNYVKVAVGETSVQLELRPKGLLIGSSGPSIWRAYRREYGRLVRLPNLSVMQADDVLVIILGRIPDMTNACLDGILENFNEVLVSGRTSMAEVVSIPLVSE